MGSKTRHRTNADDKKEKRPRTRAGTKGMGAIDDEDNFKLKVKEMAKNALKQVSVLFRGEVLPAVAFNNTPEEKDGEGREQAEFTRESGV